MQAAAANFTAPSPVAVPLPRFMAVSLNPPLIVMQYYAHGSLFDLLSVSRALACAVGLFALCSAPCTMQCTVRCSVRGVERLVGGT